MQLTPLLFLVKQVTSNKNNPRDVDDSDQAEDGGDVARSANGDPRTFCGKVCGQLMLKGNPFAELSTKELRKLGKYHDNLGSIGADLILEGLRGEEDGVKGALQCARQLDEPAGLLRLLRENGCEVTFDLEHLEHLALLEPGSVESVDLFDGACNNTDRGNFHDRDSVLKTRRVLDAAVKTVPIGDGVVIAASTVLWADANGSLVQMNPLIAARSAPTRRTSS